MPADLALFRVVHTEVSTEPVDLKPRGMMKLMPLDLKHEAVVVPTDADTCIGRKKKKQVCECHGAETQTSFVFLESVRE